MLHFRIRLGNGTFVQVLANDLLNLAKAHFVKCLTLYEKKHQVFTYRKPIDQISQVIVGDDQILLHVKFTELIVFNDWNVLKQCVVRYPSFVYDIAQFWVQVVLRRG